MYKLCCAFLFAVLLPSFSTRPTDDEPILSKNIYQGDILISDEAMEEAKQHRLHESSFGGVAASGHTYGSVTYGRWPNATVPYVMSDRIKANAKAMRVITEALALYENHTCIRFVKRRNNDANYIHFIEGGGCFAHVGMKPGGQPVSIGKGCRRTGTVQHEVGHSLGMFHEQSRPDRDDYVRLHMQNCYQGMEFNFDVMPGIDSLGTPYDLGSMMHYSAKAFSKNGFRTLTTIDRSKQHLIDTYNLVEGFSATDIVQLKRMYCNEPVPTLPPRTRAPCSGNKKPKSKCERWAAKGYCLHTYENFMETNCCVTCNAEAKKREERQKKCGDNQDTNSQCGGWANASPSHCIINPSYMFPNCQYACCLAGHVKKDGN